MKIKVILILLLACLLVACDSQKEVDEKVIKYLEGSNQSFTNYYRVTQL